MRVACYDAHVIRRVHTQLLREGDVVLDAAAARHVRDVLRLTEGTRVEVFDDDGAAGDGVIVATSPDVVVRVERVTAADGAEVELIVAAAVPKGDRADWMVEKLSELGVARFTPLAAARSVVLPEGKNKRDRWTRIATEAAKQSRRRGVMRIDSLTPLDEAIRDAGEDGAYLSTAPDAVSMVHALAAHPRGRLVLFIGPEGGWTDEEMRAFAQAGMQGLRLTATVLRVETAAIAAAAVAASVLISNPPGRP
jgi:16S rRNA (uracil1498-N3)-methyltransferase